MNLDIETKEDIQFFVYYLFKGSLDPRFFKKEYNYLDKLLSSPSDLYKCFEIFVYSFVNDKNIKPETYVTNFIINLHENKGDIIKMDLIHSEIILNDFWLSFLELSKNFCFNSFENPMKDNYLLELNGCGSDAVLYFSVWTNIIQIDENWNVLNKKEASMRANERIKMWENYVPLIQFEDWELEQEIY